MYGSSSGLSLRALLCFIPGLDRRKAWHPKGELRTLVKSLSKEEINTRRLTRKNVQYYGSSSSEAEDEDSDYHSSKHRFSVDDEDSCRPAFLLLPPRPEESATDDTLDSGVNSKSYKSHYSPPEIVLHLPSDSESNPDKHNGGLITDESMDDFAEIRVNMDSPAHSESTWRSPMIGDSGSESTHHYVTCSDITGPGVSYHSDTETHSDSCSTCVTPESSLTSSLSEDSKQPSHNGWNCSEHSSSVSAEVHIEPTACQDTGIYIEAHFDLIKPLKAKESNAHEICKSEEPRNNTKQVTDIANEPTKITSTLENYCPPAVHQMGADLNNGYRPQSQSTESLQTVHTIHSEKLEAPSSINSTPKLSMRGLMCREVDDLSSSNDSRSFSYVSVPKKTFVPNPDPPDCTSITSEQSDISDTTFWSSSSNIAEDEIANIISRDPSTHHFKSTYETAKTVSNDTITEVNDKGAGNETPSKRRFGLDLVVNALVGKSPSSSSRFNPFNTAEPEVDNKQLHGSHHRKGKDVSLA